MGTTNNLIDAAEAHASCYDGDPRPGIRTDVLNAFYQGAAWGLGHGAGLPPRALLAGLAMQGLLAGGSFSGLQPDILAHQSVAIADALLARMEDA